jgi:hypothetical protein
MAIEVKTSNRYHCQECSDFDLCEACFQETGQTHNHDGLDMIKYTPQGTHERDWRFC